MSKFKLKHQRNSAILNNGGKKVLKQFPQVTIPTLKPMMPNTLGFPKVPIPIVQPDQFGNVDPLAKNIAMVTLKHDRQNAAKEAERLRQLEAAQLKKDALNAMQKGVLDKKIDWDATNASWLNSMNEGNEEVVDQSFKNQLDEVVDNSDSGVLMMKKNSSTPFKMKHQSPLNDGVLSSSGNEEKNKDAFSVQADLTDSGYPWSTLTTEEIKALEGSGNRPPKQLYKGQVVYPNENIAWQTPEQAAATEELENRQSNDYPSWESKMSEDEKKRLAELKANTQTNPKAHAKTELAYYNSLKSKYNN